MKKAKNKHYGGLYLIGSLALAAGSMMVMPRIINYIASQLDDTSYTEREDDDWGPVIVKKEQSTKEAEHGEL